MATGNAGITLWWLVGNVLCTYWLSKVGPDGKIFGSRSGRTDRARENIWLEVRAYGPSAARSVRHALGPYALTSSQIFSRPARPYSVNKHFIIWPLTVENFESIRSDGCARGTITWKFLQQKFVIYFFASNKKLTIHRKLIFVHAKKANRKLT